MSDYTLPTEAVGLGADSTSFLVRLCRTAVLARLRAIRRGELTVIEGRDRSRFGQVTPEGPLTATLLIQDPHCYVDMALGGSIGFGRSYGDGGWSSPDLTALGRLFVQNQDALDGIESGPARLLAPLFKLGHALRRNTTAGSRRNIMAHYDLGNELFSTFLDDTMMYSCAYFEREDQPLREASVAKNDRICRKLSLGPGDHLLEIGTGWGGFAVHAARHYGCRVTTTTISRRQYDWAAARVKREGLDHLITVLLTDYRDLTGQYDKLVSIEMIEAVGHRYLDTYFRRCSERLTPEGLMLIQAITVADQRYERVRKSVDFIKHFIFPGCCLPSVTRLSEALTSATDLRLLDLEDITAHYPITLRRWCERFMANLPRVRALGYPDSFIRMWELYLRYCEAGFMERYIGTVQLMMHKPLWRESSLAPIAR
jgi:cyclopropane-fatty-acyl-phospholipid synthase